MNSGDEYLNDVTLKFLTNIDYQKLMNPGNGDIIKTNKSKNTGLKIYKQKDKKFYKKRILNIVKILLNDIEDCEKNNTLFPDIKKTFDIFIKTSIDYLKSMDKCDIIQSDYKNLNMENVSNNIENKDCDCYCDFTKNNENNENNEINNLMMRKIIEKKNLLDSFVKRVSTHQPITIIPKKKKLNLHDPELKTKGLVVENISENKNTNIYKETTSELESSLKNDYHEEKIPNKKNLSEKKFKKEKKQKNTKNTIFLSLE